MWILSWLCLKVKRREWRLRLSTTTLWILTCCVRIRALLTWGQRWKPLTTLVTLKTRMGHTKSLASSPFYPNSTTQDGSTPAPCPTQLCQNQSQKPSRSSLQSFVGRFWSLLSFFCCSSWSWWCWYTAAKEKSMELLHTVSRCVVRTWEKNTELSSIKSGLDHYFHETRIFSFKTKASCKASIRYIHSNYNQ